ncbi:MAG: DUF6438 domain-containing protein [Aureispira sp.]
MNKVLFYVGLLSLYSCSPLPTTSLYTRQLQGDWGMNVAINSTDPISIFSTSSTGPYFSFQGQQCTYFYLSQTYHDFALKEDTLILERLPYHQESTVKDSFQILHLQEDSLVLSTINGHQSDTFRLKKLTPQNEVELQSLVFQSGPCHGKCPMQYIELDSSGQLTFHGVRHTTKKGFYSGQLSKKKLEDVLQKIHQLDLDDLQESYIAPWIHDRTCALVLTTTNETYKSSALGQYKEPIALRLLFHELEGLYQKTFLESDSIMDRNFYNNTIYPTPLPPPPVE